MDARYIVSHINSEEQSGLDALCTSVRYFNSTYQSESYTALNQKCLKRNYDQMSSPPFSGPGQVMLSDGRFSKPLAHQQPFLYHQPYSIPFDAPLGPEIPHLVQEPKFPPQTFDIPDIQDSNSVFGNGGFDSTFGDYPTAIHPPSLSTNPRQSYDFYGSPTPDHSQCRSLVPTFQTWQSRVVSSSAGSTNSSPVSQADELMTAVTDSGSQLQQPQQAQPAKSNSGLVSSHSAVSRLPNKKARSPKRRKRKDPNEPQKPVSAYSLFFRNAQAAIKSQNPSATFGDVSKIVASMWDGLDDEVKNFYKRQMEMAKKEYLKQLAIYRATLVSKEVQGKTGTDGETGITAQNPSAPPAPPPSQKLEDGSGVGTLSPIPAPLCMPSSGYQSQNPLSPTAEPVNHMMSPSTVTHHPQSSPLFYSDGPPCLQISYSSPSDPSMMRNSFLPYSQNESLMPRMSAEQSQYFHGMASDSGYKSGEYISLGNNFVNGLCRELAGRSFAEPEGDGQKLT